LEDFFDGFPAALFAVDVFAAFLAVFTPRLPFFAAFFGADVLAARFVLAAFLPPFSLTDFFLAFATTISFIAQTRLLGDDRLRGA
jgi:hypothetical protein